MRLADLKSRLSKHLAEIGRTEYDCPKPRGNHDPLMHAYMIDTECAAFFKKQREKSLKELLLACDPDEVDSVTTAAADEKAKQEKLLLNDKLYMLMLNVKTPAQTLNVTSLRNKLTLGGRYTPKEIDALFEDSTTARLPAKSFSVVPL